MFFGIVCESSLKNFLCSFAHSLLQKKCFKIANHCFNWSRNMSKMHSIFFFGIAPFLFGETMEDENFCGLLSNLFHELDKWEDPNRHDNRFVFTMWCSIFINRPFELSQLWPTNQVYYVLIILYHIITAHTYTFCVQ